MANTLSISVIVPVYNVEKYIRLCIDSILAQTFQDFEIILIDDASPDGSVELCQKFYGDNPKVKLIRHEKNLGLGAARNIGMKHAVGKYICFVDSDDLILPDTLEKFYAVAEQNNADVVRPTGWVELYQEENAPVQQQDLKLVNDSYAQEGFLLPNVRYRLDECWNKYKLSTMAWMCFCRREFLEEHQIQFLPIIAEDETFSFALLCLTERYYIFPETFYVYRKRPGSIMKSKTAEQFSKIIQSIALGATYVKSFLEHIPPFENYGQWCNEILETFFDRFVVGQTARYYENLTLSADMDAVADQTLKNLFGDNAGFAKYFFDGFHAFRRQAEILSQNNRELSAQITSLIERAELSDRKIVFVNFLGRGFGCNPKYIALEIIRQNLPYDLVWLVNDLNEPMPEQIRKVVYGSVDSIYELATAKVIVSNVKNLLPYPDKKQGQFFIMTWHGGQSFKRIEKDAEENLSPAYVAQSKANSAITDLMMVSTQEQFDEFKRVMWYDGEILKCGLPRNDILFRRDENLIAQVRQSLNVPPENKIVMYAPTFRNDVAVTAEVCRLDAKKLLAALKKRFGGDWTLLIRHHPNVANAFVGASFGDNVINATAYPDVQELILVADVIISDYSSVVVDGMLAGKTVFIYAKDFDTYPKERGFAPHFFELPYKVNKSEAELFKCIKNYNAAAMEPKIKRFLDMVKPFDDGHASEAVVSRIKDAIGFPTAPALPEAKDKPTDSSKNQPPEDIFRQLLENPIFRSNVDLLTKVSIQEKDIQNVMQTLDLVDDRYYYELMDTKPRKPKILDVPSGIDKLLSSGKSFCRMGDGECKLMCGIPLDFQEYDHALAEKLLQILQDKQTNCYVGIPRYYWYIRDDIERNGNPYHKRYYTFNIPPIRKFYEEHYNPNKTYIDACLGGYMSNKSAAFCEERFNKLKTLFNGRKVLIVAGETVFNNITYDFFDGAIQKEILLAPRINAWRHFDEIMEKTLTYPKDFVVALILGPTATVLAYELSKRGRTAYDIGHVPKDYDAFLKNADRSAGAIAKFYAAD